MSVDVDVTILRHIGQDGREFHTWNFEKTRQNNVLFGTSDDIRHVSTLKFHKIGGTTGLHIDGSPERNGFDDDLAIRIDASKITLHKETVK